LLFFLRRLRNAFAARQLKLFNSFVLITDIARTDRDIGRKSWTSSKQAIFMFPAVFIVEFRAKTRLEVFCIKVDFDLVCFVILVVKQCISSPFANEEESGQLHQKNSQVYHEDPEN